MGTIALFGLLAVTPALALWGATAALERFTRPDRRARRRTGDLRRLEGDYRRIESSDAPMRTRRLQAVRMAYDDTLASCCRAVGVQVVATPPLSALHRLETEAALARRGVTW